MSPFDPSARRSWHGASPSSGEHLWHEGGAQGERRDGSGSGPGPVFGAGSTYDSPLRSGAPPSTSMRQEERALAQEQQAGSGAPDPAGVTAWPNETRAEAPSTGFHPVTPAADGSAPIAEGAVLGELSAALAAALSRRLSPEQYATWFRRVRLVKLDERTATFAVPNEFAREWIASYYLDPMAAAVLASLGVKRRVELRVDPEAAVEHTAYETGSNVPVQTTQGSAEATPDGDRPRRGPDTLGGGRSHGRPSDPPAAPSGRNGFTDPHAHRGGDPHGRADQGGRHGANGRGEVAPRGGPPARSVVPSRPAREREESGPLERDMLLHSNSDIVLNPRYTFENYVVGPCNRFAHAAAMGAAEHPGRAYNPLFLHGRVGVGKTHLLQALCFMILERQPASRILYLSCETFVNHFINALENGDLMEFRDKYRNVDVLVVDDIQLLANKERTQEEFFHTFNTLYNAGKQIVLSSDSPPKDIPTLQDRLVSRFKWGMVTEVSPPCFETRVAIVKRKGRERGHEVPDEVAQFIAEHIEENVRELEGAVTRLLGYAGITAQALDVTLARNALADLIEVQRGAPTMEDILATATAHFSVKLSDLQSKRRTAAIAYPRQVAMFLARRITRHSLEEIGGFFGGRDHTTVLYAVDKIAKLCDKDPATAKVVGNLLEKLSGRR
jgi:chromosomal replication initiator protein